MFLAIDLSDQQSIFGLEQNDIFYDMCHKSNSSAVISNLSFKYCQHHLEFRKKKEQLITMPIEQKMLYDLNTYSFIIYPVLSFHLAKHEVGD